MPIVHDRSGRIPSRGRCFLYVFPCGWEDLLKLGISRDPLDRLQALHPRWFEFFDLDRGHVVEFDRVREARAQELSLGHRLAEHRAVAPLTVRAAAGGHTEWFRGASAQLDEAMQAFAAAGHAVHAPLRPWLREALQARGALLYSWTQAALDADDLAAGDAGLPHRQAVRDALDACDALGVALEPLLPEAVLAWHRGARR
ncbi:MAG TPA: GIY-YIG nuclease family protein [Xanthomonadaceae bacterium]|nr:GIY-YIG nuclease family protein [Xanthomonadaceae bacterium]